MVGISGPGIESIELARVRRYYAEEIAARPFSRSGTCDVTSMNRSPPVGFTAQVSA